MSCGRRWGRHNILRGEPHSLSRSEGVKEISSWEILHCFTASRFALRSRPGGFSRASKRDDAPDEVIRRAEIKSLGVEHLEGEIPFTLPLDFLGAGQLKLPLVAHIVPNHLFKNVVNRRPQQMHAKPAEPRVRGQVV